MYSNASLGHGSALIDFLIEKASSMHTPTHSVAILVLFLISLSFLIQPIFPNFISSGDKAESLRLWLRRSAREVVHLISQQSKKTKRNLSDALIIYPWAGLLFFPAASTSASLRVKKLSE